MAADKTSTVASSFQVVPVDDAGFEEQGIQQLHQELKETPDTEKLRGLFDETQKKIETQKQVKDALDKEFKELAQAFDSLEKENYSKTNLEVNNAPASTQELQAFLRSKEDKLKELQVLLEKWRSTIKTLTERIQKFEINSQKTREEIDQLKKNRTELQVQLPQMDKLTKALQRSIEGLKLSINRIQRAANTSETENDFVEERDEVLRLRSYVPLQGVVSSGNKLSTFEQSESIGQYHQATFKNGEFKVVCDQEIAARERYIHFLEEEIKELQDLSDDLRKVSPTLGPTLDNLTQALDEITERLRELKARLKDFEDTKVQELEDTVKSLEGQINHLEEILVSLQQKGQPSEGVEIIKDLAKDYAEETIKKAVKTPGKGAVTAEGAEVAAGEAGATAVTTTATEAATTAATTAATEAATTSAPTAATTAATTVAATEVGAEIGGAVGTAAGPGPGNIAGAILGAAVGLTFGLGLTFLRWIKKHLKQLAVASAVGFYLLMQLLAQLGVIAAGGVAGAIAGLSVGLGACGLVCGFVGAVGGFGVGAVATYAGMKAIEALRSAASTSGTFVNSALTGAKSFVANVGSTAQVTVAKIAANLKLGSLGTSFGGSSAGLAAGKALATAGANFSLAPLANALGTASSILSTAITPGLLASTTGILGAAAAASIATGLFNALPQGFIEAAFVVAPQEAPGDSGQGVPTYFKVDKKANPTEVTSFNGTAITITYTYTFDPGGQPIKITDVVEEALYYKSGSCSVGQGIPLPSGWFDTNVLQGWKNQTFSTVQTKQYQFTVDAPKWTILKDSLLVNKFTVTGETTSPPVASQSQTAIATVTLGTVQGAQPYQFPINGIITTLDDDKFLRPANYQPPPPPGCTLSSTDPNCFRPHCGEMFWTGPNSGSATCPAGGIDIAPNGGLGVKSTLPGVIKYAGQAPNLGGVVYIESCGGQYRAAFIHMAWGKGGGPGFAPGVAANKIVQRGTDLGTVYQCPAGGYIDPATQIKYCDSDVKKSSGTHIHYQVLRNNQNLFFGNTSVYPFYPPITQKNDGVCSNPNAIELNVPTQPGSVSQITQTDCTGPFGGPPQ